MAGKRSRSECSSESFTTTSSSSETPSTSNSLENSLPSKRRALSVSTMDKWIRDNDKTLDTASWLSYEKVDREFVYAMKCNVCVRFKNKLVTCTNYSSAFIDGSRNLRTSAFKDHAKSDMHQRAMLLSKKSGASNVTEYAPIAKALCTIDPATEKRVRRKFEIAYMLCKENMSFSKMAAICELEELHEVDLGHGYKNGQACTVFVEYIAQELRQSLQHILHEKRFFSIQADGSTDSANVEEEIFVALYFDPQGKDGQVRVCSKFLSVRQPSSCNASGLFQCFVRALEYVQVVGWTNKLVGFGCDGASVNIGANSLSGFIHNESPWVVCFWCMAHRLQLALKDALKSTLFSEIDNLLLRLYYLYENSPKKCRELEEVVASLKQCLAEQDGMSSTKGIRPLRASGTRFVSHKVAALERIIDRFGAYISHLVGLSQDPTVKPADQQKLKGYVKAWRRGKIILGCAFYLDILKPCSILSKVLQDEQLSIVDGIEALLKTSKSIERLKSLNMDDYPSVKKVMSRVMNSNGEVTYQGSQLTYYEQGIAILRSHKDQVVESVLTCLKDRVKIQHPELLTSVITLLATHGWEKSEGVDFADTAISDLVGIFTVPLQHAGVELIAIQDEWHDLLDYARRYLNLVRDPIQVIWWKLFNASCSSKWSNVLSLVELLFCIPISNGHVERMFSHLKHIKSEKRSTMSENHLDDLIRISVDGPSLKDWDAGAAIRLWWNDKQRRQVNDKRAAPRKKYDGTVALTDEATNTDYVPLNLDDWDNFISNDTDDICS